ncbi:MAG: AraC family transcriptional regulator [Pseudonocardiales bacterium]|nr:MAG: AraC family transcriptional regulator [Pseudonocardiales bacterium]
MQDPEAGLLGTGRPLRIGVLAYPGCFASEVFGVPDLLTIAAHAVHAVRTADGVGTVGSVGAPYEVSIVSPRRRVAASGGAHIAVTPMHEVDTLIVPGFELTPGLDLDATLASLGPEVAAIRSNRQSGAALVTICVGAFLAAEAGVLDGRRATTSWLFADALRRRHPRVDVRAENLTITDAGVTTTAAFSAMYDLALNLIRQHYGAEVARRTARIALLDDARCTQAPYVDQQLLPFSGTTFSALVTRWLDQHLNSSYHLPSLAAQFHVSTRTLLRRFRADTGQTPLEYLQTSRVRRACHLLESTDLAVSAVATAVGYRDAGTLTKIFIRHIGRKPTEYRSAFQRRGGRVGAPATLPHS